MTLYAADLVYMYLNYEKENIESRLKSTTAEIATLDNRPIRKIKLDAEVEILNLVLPKFDEQKTQLSSEQGKVWKTLEAASGDAIDMLKRATTSDAAAIINRAIIAANVQAIEEVIGSTTTGYNRIPIIQRAQPKRQDFESVELLYESSQY